MRVFVTPAKIIHDDDSMCDGKKLPEEDGQSGAEHFPHSPTDADGRAGPGRCPSASLARRPQRSEYLRIQQFASIN